jgi:hypothetical protein
MLNGPGTAYTSSFCGHNVGLNLRNKNRVVGYKFIFTLKQFVGKLWEPPVPNHACLLSLKTLEQQGLKKTCNAYHHPFLFKHSDLHTLQCT